MSLENTWQEIRDPFLHPESLQIFRYTASSLQFTSLIFYRVQVREHLTRDQRPFLHPELLQILRYTASSLSSLIFYRVQVREHLTRDQRSFLHPESLQIFRYTASSLQFTSLIFYRVQVREHLTRDQRPFLHPESLQILRYTASSLQFTHLLQGSGQRTPSNEIRDHSFIQNHSRSSDSQLLLFSSLISTGFRSENTWHEIKTILHPEFTPDLRFTASSLSVHLTHLLQGSDQRTPDTRSERPFLHPESLQIFRSQASSLQFTLTHLLQGSGQRTPDTRSENHSFIQNHSRSSDSQLLLFSSPHHLLQVQVREHLTTRSETIPSSRITPDLQIHSSSLQFTSLIFYRVQVREHLTRDQRPFLHPESLQILQIHSFFSSVHSLIFYRVQVREHLTWDQRPFLHPESLQILQIASSMTVLHLFSSSHSSSTGFRSENTWHEIRDHSFIQNHSRSSDSQLLLFSSLTHLLQGSGQRTPDTRSETIPHPESLQILRYTASSLQFHSSSTGFRSENTWHEIRDHSFIQNHSRSSDSQLLLFSSLIFYRVQVREHLTRDQRPFLHPESLQIFRYTASSLQFTHSSSTGFRSENTWHEIRDHSFIQNHSRSSDHSFFSSVHSLIFYRVQIREHLTRDQRPFLHPESLQILQIHSFFSSVHLTHLLQGSGQRTLTRRSETIPSIQNHSRSSDTQLLSLQFTSSSTGFRSENTWHEIRDHSFSRNHSRSSDSQLLLFSSLISTGFRSENTLTRDQRPFFIQNHSRSSDHSSSLQFTSLIFYGFRSENTWHEIRDHFLHPESLQIFRFTASSLQFTHSFYRVQIREHLTRDQRPFLHPESLQILDSQLLLFSSPHSSFYRVPVREHLTRDQRPFLHPESLQILQIHSFSSSVHFTHLLTGFMSENTWHEIRDHSFIRITPDLQIHRLLLFSSPHSSLQGSGQRTPDTRSETIPSSRITPDPSDTQLLLFSSLTHLLQGSRSENTWHEIRDQFLHPDHSRSSDSQLLLFSSPHSSSNRVQVREQPDRDQRPFLLQNHSDLQIHSFFSSVHSLISTQGSDQKHLTRDTRDHSFIQNHSRSSDSQLLLVSSTHSSIYRVQIRENLTWDQRPFFIQNHSDLQIPQLLLFSSLTHLLQGSDQRTPDTRSETIPSPESLQILQIASSMTVLHLFSSSHSSSTGVQVRDNLTWDQSPFLHPNHSRSSDSQLLLFSSLTHLLQGSGSENTGHEIRDHSFIQNHSRSSIHSFFSSVHFTHLLRVSGQRTPDERSETIPSSRITPDLQIHSFFSSVHTHLIFYRLRSGEHLTRDQRPFLHRESLQIFRFTASSLQFTHLLQGSGQRTGMDIAEAWFCAQWPTLCCF